MSKVHEKYMAYTCYELINIAATFHATLQEVANVASVAQSIYAYDSDQMLSRLLIAVGELGDKAQHALAHPTGLTTRAETAKDGGEA